MSITKNIFLHIYTPYAYLEPWVTCHEILVPGDNEIPLSTAASTTSVSGAHNAHIQKLLLLIERLTDRDLERRLAVHLKYHELEDEGTARAMPSAGLMGLVYYMVQIRPVLNDDEIVDRLIKLQSIKVNIKYKTKENKVKISKNSYYHDIFIYENVFFHFHFHFK